MATKKKYKRLTNKEKQFNKELRAEWREKGILPPVKPKLNRKKFAKEVIAEFEDNFEAYTDIPNLYEAIRCMMPDKESKRTVSPEQVGVLKVLKLALEIKKFKEDLRAKGKTKYSVGELYEKVIAPVLNL